MDLDFKKLNLGKMIHGCGIVSCVSTVCLLLTTIKNFVDIGEGPIRDIGARALCFEIALSLGSACNGIFYGISSSFTSWAVLGGFIYLMLKKESIDPSEKASVSMGMKLGCYNALLIIIIQTLCFCFYHSFKAGD